MYPVLAKFVERMQFHGKLARLTEEHYCEHLLLMYHVVSISAKVGLSRELRADAE